MVRPKLIKFFEKKKMEEMKRNILSMMDLIEKCNARFRELFDLALKGSDFEKLFEEVHMYEHGADIIRRSLLDSIERSALESTKKTALTNVVRRMDDIADWILAGARIIKALSQSSDLSKMPENLKELIIKTIEANTKAIFAVKTMIAALLNGDIDTALGVADEVERYEELVDTYFMEMVTIIYNYKGEEIPQLGLMSLVNAVENVSDACEDTCDEIRLAAVSSSWNE